VDGEAPRADVFDLLNIVPYVRKFKTSKLLHCLYHGACKWADVVDPVSGKALETSQLIKLNFFKVSLLLALAIWSAID
jgi:peptidyl-prolyl cis-trans isomerase-like protein 2